MEQDQAMAQQCYVCLQSCRPETVATCPGCACIVYCSPKHRRTHSRREHAGAECARLAGFMRQEIQFQDQWDQILMQSQGEDQCLPQQQLLPRVQQHQILPPGGDSLARSRDQQQQMFPMIQQEQGVLPMTPLSGPPPEADSLARLIQLASTPHSCVRLAAFPGAALALTVLHGLQLLLPGAWDQPRGGKGEVPFGLSAPGAGDQPLPSEVIHVHLLGVETEVQELVPSFRAAIQAAAAVVSDAQLAPRLLPPKLRLRLSLIGPGVPPALDRTQEHIPGVGSVHFSRGLYHDVIQRRVEAGGTAGRVGTASSDVSDTGGRVCRVGTTSSDVADIGCSRVAGQGGMGHNARGDPQTETSHNGLLRSGVKSSGNQVTGRKQQDLRGSAAQTGGAISLAVAAQDAVRTPDALAPPDTVAAPDAVLLLNAGLPAFPDWVPTLKKLALARCPLLVTDFNLEAAHRAREALMCLLLAGCDDGESPCYTHGTHREARCAVSDVCINSSGISSEADGQIGRGAKYVVSDVLINPWRSPKPMHVPGLLLPSFSNGAYFTVHFC